MISGVAQVIVNGAQKYAVRTQLNPQELASYGLGIDEVSRAVQQGNDNLPTGTLYGKNQAITVQANGQLTVNQAITVQANGQLTEAKAYNSLIVAYRNGSPVRLEELGKISNSVENDKVASWFSGTRAIVLSIQRQPGTNTVEVVDAIKKLLPSFRAQMPAAAN